MYITYASYISNTSYEDKSNISDVDKSFKSHFPGSLGHGDFYTIRQINLFKFCHLWPFLPPTFFFNWRHIYQNCSRGRVLHYVPALHETQILLFNSTITAGLPLCFTFSFMWSLWEIFSNSVFFFSWNLKLHCQVRKIKEPLTIQPFQSGNSVQNYFHLI